MSDDRVRDQQGAPGGPSGNGAPVVTAAASAGRTRVVAGLAWIGLAVALASGIVALAAGPGYRLGWWRLGTAFASLRWAVIADLFALAAALVAAALAYRYRARGALFTSVTGLALSVAIAGPPLYYWRQAQSAPHIHDVTTDTVNPPQYVAILPLRKEARNPTDYRAETAALQKNGYPDIGPALLDIAPADALSLAERVARSMGWDIVAVSANDLRIEATDTTPMFGFKDDIVIRVQANGTGSRVDVRSLSRIGGSDVGTNATRIRAYLRQISAAKH